MNQKLFTDTQFGVALIAAPIFTLFYSKIFQQKTDNPFWLTDNITFIFLYPIIEELAFRGTIQEYFTRYFKQNRVFYNLSYANLLTSFFFMLIHFVHHPIIWAISTFFPSLVFGYFKERYNNVIPSIILHIFYNFCYFSIIGN